LKIIVEIVINLVGAEVFAVYLLDGESGQLDVAVSEGAETSEFPSCSKPGGIIAKSLETEEPLCGDPTQPQNLEEPIVCIPLIVQNRPIGLIGIFGLLQQKNGFSALDHELFSVMGGHASTALFAARLYSQSERKLNTIQGFIDLLTK
jgi:GAF domain-containing protein